ncbi:MAG: endonuclease domain-containing protein [Dehalococcoidia bacterium]|nr:endonuclease domain-containing protein [Dehalococcoidia bacterium]
MNRPTRHRSNVPGARSLRRQPAQGERELWDAVRDRRFRGLKFRRQQPFGPFVVDFYCHDLRLAVELDGGVHRSPTQAAFDRRRQASLESHGVRVVRLDAALTMSDPAGALTIALNPLIPGPSPPLTPGPSPRGRGGRAF